MLTPAMFTRIEEILLLSGLALAGAFYLARWARTRGAAQPALPGPRPPVVPVPTEQHPTKYHPALVVIHWFVVFAMANLILRGALIMRYVPNDDPAKIDALTAHMLAGVLVLSLMVIRLFVRRATGLPPRATTHNRHLDRLARVSHRLLYALVIAQALSGLFMAVQTGLAEIVLTGQGSLPADFWAFSIRSVHYALSRLLVVLIALHFTGALYHTLLLKDGLLRRMTFGRRIAAGRGASHATEAR